MCHLLILPHQHTPFSYNNYVTSSRSDSLTLSLSLSLLFLPPPLSLIHMHTYPKILQEFIKANGAISVFVKTFKQFLCFLQKFK